MDYWSDGELLSRTHAGVSCHVLSASASVKMPLQLQESRNAEKPKADKSFVALTSMFSPSTAP